MNEPQLVRQILGTGQTDFRKIINRAKQLRLINDAFKKLLPVGLHNHIMIMNIREQTVIVGADSAARMTQLRFESQNLLIQIKQIPGLAEIDNIQFKIQPSAFIPSGKPARRAAMSGKASAILQHAADSFDDPGLKSALKRLSKNHSLR